MPSKSTLEKRGVLFLTGLLTHKAIQASLPLLASFVDQQQTFIEISNANLIGNSD